MIFDMTNYYSNIKSLAELLELKEEEILGFDYANLDVIDFLEQFNIEDEKLLGKDIELVSLHSTASIDNCKSIKENGLINLQDAVSVNTPLKNYLENKEIQINIAEKYILFKGKKLDISEETVGYCLEDEEEYRNRVIYKFYKDYQINGFLITRNILNYGGGTRRRPEILLDLGRYLKDNSIELDWDEYEKKTHHVIKFKQPLNCYTYYTYLAEYDDSDYGITKSNLEYLSNEVIELKVKKWLIQKSLNILEDGACELFSYVNPQIKVEPKDIIEIMTEEEYIEKYNITENI